MPAQYKVSNHQDTGINWVLYTLTIILSFVVLSILTGGMLLFSMLFGLGSSAITYIFVVIISFGLGLSAALVLRKVTGTKKAFLIGGLAPSLLPAILLFLILSAMNSLSRVGSGIDAGTTELSSLGVITTLLPATPNTFLTASLLFIFFNIPFIFMYLKEE